MNNDKRLIEVAFPLKQTSLDSVHEKNVRHGHISTLHIWPARRPLAACRAALIAALLPDPGDSKKRKEILEKMAGRVVENDKEETVGGILHWGRESSPDLDWFREEIRKAYGGRAPKVLDPFAGGGAIPLEAMRLGCEVTAADINPVAWLILKCTLDYPQKIAGQTRPLPDFALEDSDFMAGFLKAQGYKGETLRSMQERLGHGDGKIQFDALPNDDPMPEADLAWHLRAWGRRVLTRARKELAGYYPTYADLEPTDPDVAYEPQSMRLLEPDENGECHPGPLNAGFNDTYLMDPRNPRWVAKPTVAYLWARTVRCKHCRATLPLLKTRWLCRKPGKRVRLTMEANADRSGVVFDVESDVPRSGNAAADRRMGQGTMSRQGAYCPCCSTPEAPAITTMEDIRHEGRAGRLGATMTAVVVDGRRGKEYRLPTAGELAAAEVSDEELQALYADIPFGLPDELTPKGGSGAARAFSVRGYGFDQWAKLFTDRQLLLLGTFVRAMRLCPANMANLPKEWREAIVACLALSLGRLADYGSVLGSWQNSRDTIGHTFARFALPIVWDFAESCPLTERGGGFIGAIDWIARVVAHLQDATEGAPSATVLQQSAINIPNSPPPPPPRNFDLICTDPPYYDAIPYSDLMDFFHVWLRRVLHGVLPESDSVFAEPLGPKWNESDNDGELIDDASRFGGDKALSKKNYEDGMARAFRACHGALNPGGRLVVVFANKSPDAWETLVAALIRAGFVVDGSWPIQTEMQTRQRSLASAALASSVWIVCRKRPSAARPGWDSSVLTGMRENITRQLRDFWDAGIRGPDFVWSATGPALEAYSKYPVVKKADDPGQVMSVSEFLREVRRMVVDFVVGRVLTEAVGEGGAAPVANESLDDVTTYYLLHRHDFGMEAAPVGACILYALSCNLSDAALIRQHDLLARAGGASNPAPGEERANDEGAGGGSGASVRLKSWSQRQGRNLGLEAPGGKPAPLIDQVHKLMHLWRAGDQAKVNDYLESRGLKRNLLFNQLLQALIELGAAGSDERAILEAISNHLAARERTGSPRQGRLV